MSACPLQAVLGDFEDTWDNLNDEYKNEKREITLVADSLRLGGAILAQYPGESDKQIIPNKKITDKKKLQGKSHILKFYLDMLAPQLIGRLLSELDGNDHIRSLLRQCDEQGLHQNGLIPTYHCLHTPGKYLNILQK